tara:strand:- start:148 stop:381 length:234 start_codon:yes stop_codon:yes gene_type:complete
MKKNSKKLELIIKKNLNLKGKISFEKIKKFKVGEEIDSLKFITIIADISKVLKIEINPEDIAKIKTIKDLVKLSNLK